MSSSHVVVQGASAAQWLGIPAAALDALWLVYLLTHPERLAAEAIALVALPALAAAGLLPSPFTRLGSVAGTLLYAAWHVWTHTPLCTPGGFCLPT